MKTDGVSAPLPPPPAAVPRNDWTGVARPDIGTWEPDRLVTVVIPYFEAQIELDLTLAALTRQTYPQDLLEVIVVDDGSAVAPVVADHAAGLDVSIHVQEDRGFGLARARNLGAQVARGEILIFIDCDMIPEAQHVEAHARWHHVVSDALVFGFRWHADFSDVTAETLVTAVAAGDIRSILPGQSPQRPEWIEGHLDRTDMLSASFDDQFLVTSGGNLSIRRNHYLDIGGTDESFDQWGGEDNEFGFRAVQAGLIVIPDRQAVCWHQGEGHEPSPEEVQSHRLQQPKMRNMIAELGYRNPTPGCSYTVPYVVVTIDAGEAPAELTSRTVESILESRFHDLIVIVHTPRNDGDRAWLRRRFVSDGRVVVVDETLDLDETYRFSPVRLSVPPRALLHENTMTEIVDMVRAAGVGILFATLPDTTPGTAVLTAVSTRALNRGRRLADSPKDVESTIGELFGERWVSGRALGLGWLHSSLEVTTPVNPYIDRSIDDGVDGADDSRTDIETQLADLRSRRALRLADAAGSLKSSRSASDAAFAVKAVMRAVRGKETPPDDPWLTSRNSPTQER